RLVLSVRCSWVYSSTGEGMGNASREGARPGQSAVVASVTCPVTLPGRPATGRSVDNRWPARYRVARAVSELDHRDRHPTTPPGAGGEQAGETVRARGGAAQRSPTSPPRHSRRKFLGRPSP